MKKINWRAFISQLTTWSFIAITISGVILYIVPHTRIANWIDLRLLWLTKAQWQSIHILTCFLFLIAASFHIYYNWNALKNYLLKKVSITKTFKKEFILSFLIFLFVIISSIYNIPPLKYIIDLNEYIKNSWGKSAEYEPPFPYADQMSLRDFTKKMKMDLNIAMDELKSKGVVVEKETETLREIARRNNTTPMQIYALIKKTEPKEEGIIKSYNPEKVEEKFEGRGIGRKTLLQICNENNIDISLAKKKLAEHGITVKENDTLKEIADQNNIAPIEILKIILVENYNVR
ncbi:DUF4405 domain-containing protein [Thermodesulfovibrio hydrogeniphilus]